MKINWWSSHGVFECYNYGELEYLKKDFATGFVVRLYLLIEIYRTRECVSWYGEIQNQRSEVLGKTFNLHSNST